MCVFVAVAAAQCLSVNVICGSNQQVRFCDMNSHSVSSSSMLRTLCNVLLLYLNWQDILTPSLISQAHYQPPVETETSSPRGVYSIEVSIVLLLIGHLADKEQDLATELPRSLKETACLAHVLY